MRRALFAAIIATAGCVDMSLATRRRFVGRAATAATAAAATPAFAAKTYVSGKSRRPRARKATRRARKRMADAFDESSNFMSRIVRIDFSMMSSTWRWRLHRSDREDGSSSAERLREQRRPHRYVRRLCGSIPSSSKRTGQGRIDAVADHHRRRALRRHADDRSGV